MILILCLWRAAALDSADCARFFLVLARIFVLALADYDHVVLHTLGIFEIGDNLKKAMCLCP